MQAVVDTNVLIDLVFAKLLDVAFRLPYQFVAPDVVLAELAQSDELLAAGLAVKVLSGAQVASVFEFAGRYRGPSRVDLFALGLAKSEGGMLLTGDGALRKAAQAEKVEVHGTLWVLDQLVESGLLDPGKAAAALKSLFEVVPPRRLPRGEVEHRLGLWLNLH